LSKETTIDLSEVKRGQKVISRRVSDIEENFKTEIAKTQNRIEA